jgi:hypothetical protein
MCSECGRALGSRCFSALPSNLDVEGFITKMVEAKFVSYMISLAFDR